MTTPPRAETLGPVTPCRGARPERGTPVTTPLLTRPPAGRPRQRAGAVVAIARWSAHHRWTVVTLWVLGVALAVVVCGAVGTRTLTGAQSGSGESGRADVVL